MSDYTIIENCSPTLAGLKTGSLFSCDYESKEEVFRQIRRLNQKLRRKGLHIIPVVFYETRVVIYLYRPDLLSKDLNNETAAGLLKDLGYHLENTEGCVAFLRRKMMKREENWQFPHEVGFFLGYPPEDVVGFMENKARDFKCVGCWKVYGDVDKARERFRAFRECTRCYAKRFCMGAKLEELVVETPA